MRRFFHRPLPGPLAAAIALALASAAPVRAQSVFTTIPGIPGFGTTLPNSGPAQPQARDRRGRNRVLPVALSADGSAVAGTHRYLEQTWGFYRGCQLLCFDFIDSAGGAQAFGWNGASAIGLGYPSNATGVLEDPICISSGCPVGIRESIATGISADGRTVVGYGRTGCINRCVQPPEPAQAFIWTAADGLREIAGPGSMALGISGDGRVVVGSNGSAFAWTASGGRRELVGLDPGPSLAVAASFDGGWIVGQSAFLTDSAYWGTVVRATLWGPDRLPIDLGSIGNEPTSFASDISFDGDVAVGHGMADGIPLAFRWTRSGGIVSLGTLPGQTGSMATAVSGDGNVVVGNSSASPLGFVAGLPFRWTVGSGMQSIASWLAAGGVALPGDIELTGATDTNYNGNVVIGTYRRGTAFSDEYGYLARVGDAGNGFLSDVDAFRSGVAESGLRTLDAAALLPHVASATARRHGGWNATLREDARGCGWVAAWQTRYRDGGPEIDAQEVGACVGMGPVRLAAGVGRLDTEQHWALGGGSDVGGRYAMLGVVAPMGPVQASLTGYRGRFDARAERRYANGAGVDASAARPEGEFRGAVVRLDWVDVFRRGRLGVSPYLTGAWSTSDVDAYTETDGGFPVAYAAASVDARELALGAFADFHVNASTSVGLGLETSRRRVDTGEGVGARVIGLFDASVAGATADDVDSHVQLRVRQDIARGWSLYGFARGAIDGEERDRDIGLQLRAAF